MKSTVKIHSKQHKWRIYKCNLQYISNNVTVGIPHSANTAVQKEQIVQFTLV